MAPRATRFRAVDDSPLAFLLPRQPKFAPKGILRRGASQKKRREQKKVAFGDVKTKKVTRWIGFLQVRCLPAHRLVIRSDISIRVMSPRVSCSSRAYGARGGPIMSTLILAGYLPVTSSDGLAWILRTIGSTPTCMANHYPGAPMSTARTAAAIGGISINDDNRRNYQSDHICLACGL